MIMCVNSKLICMIHGSFRVAGKITHLGLLEPTSLN